MRENDNIARWYSVLNSENSNAIKSDHLLRLKNNMFLGKRYETTAAASDASSSLPTEKYEYQAEVLSILVYISGCPLNNIEHNI